jgi:hypothetical protein
VSCPFLPNASHSSACLVAVIATAVAVQLVLVQNLDAMCAELKELCKTYWGLSWLSREALILSIRADVIGQANAQVGSLLPKKQLASDSEEGLHCCLTSPSASTCAAAPNGECIGKQDFDSHMPCKISFNFRLCCVCWEGKACTLILVSWTACTLGTITRPPTGWQLAAPCGPLPSWTSTALSLVPRLLAGHGPALS